LFGGTWVLFGGTWVLFGGTWVLFGGTWVLFGVSGFVWGNMGFVWGFSFCFYGVGPKGLEYGVKGFRVYGCMGLGAGGLSVRLRV
jgi:hypothetical protein